VPLRQGVRMDEVLRRQLPPPPEAPKHIEHGGHH
jgi:hypothetical protein